MKKIVFTVFAVMFLAHLTEVYAQVYQSVVSPQQFFHTPSTSLYFTELTIEEYTQDIDDWISNLEEEEQKQNKKLASLEKKRKKKKRQEKIDNLREEVEILSKELHEMRAIREQWITYKHTINMLKQASENIAKGKCLKIKLDEKEYEMDDFQITTQNVTTTEAALIIPIYKYHESEQEGWVKKTTAENKEIYCWEKGKRYHIKDVQGTKKVLKTIPHGYQYDIERQYFIKKMTSQTEGVSFSLELIGKDMGLIFNNLEVLDCK